MTDNMQLPPAGGSGGYSAVAAPPGSPPSRALVTAVLLVIAGAVLGLIGGAVWAAAAPRVVYQVAALNPPTAYATNPETNAFIAADGIYTFIALGGGVILGLVGYFAGVRRYGPVPMAGVVLGALAAAFLTRWLGPVLTGQDSFNAQLGASKTGEFLRAPIALGASGALAFWPVAAGLVAGGLELVSTFRLRQVSQFSQDGPAGVPSGRHAQAGRRGLFGPRAGQGQPDRPASPAAGEPSPDSRRADTAGPAPPLPPWRPADEPRGASAGQAWFPPDPPAGGPGHPVSGAPPPDPGNSIR
jgi:hypothetical protein